MKNILITGASGFVGAHLAKYYLERDFEVISILHDEKPVTSSKLLGIHDQISWCKGSLLDESFVKRVIADYELETVIHCAALPIVRVGTRTTTPIFSANVMGTINLLEAVKDQHLSGYGIKLLYFGTDKEYGYAPLNKPYSEETCLSGLNVYDASKAMADIACQCYAHSFKVPIGIIRVCNIFGPGDINSRLIPNTIRKCIKGESPIIFKDIEYVREFIYVRDVCRAVERLLDNVGTTGRNPLIYNVGSGIWMDQKQCIEEILKFFPHLHAEYQEPPNYTRIEIPYQRLETGKIWSDLGWEANVTFEKGLNETVQWYKEASHYTK